MDWYKYRTELEQLPPETRGKAIAEAERLVFEEGWDADRAVLEALGLFSKRDQEIEIRDEDADVDVEPARWYAGLRSGSPPPPGAHKLEDFSVPEPVHHRRRRGARRDSR